jgi:hypothetical protein
MTTYPEVTTQISGIIQYNQQLSVINRFMQLCQ